MKLGVFAVEFDPDFFLEIGVDSLVFPFDTSKDVLRRAEKDFEVFLEFKPFENGVVENVFGEKTNLKALGCPSDEKLRDKNLSKLEDVEYEVILDFVRFPSPANGDFFYSCFCENCREKAKELGYDLDNIKRNVKGYLKTDDIKLLEDWFNFKKEVIKDYLEWSGLKRAFFFTPSLSFLVGQSYDFELKCIHPMIYPEDMGPACIEYELSYMKGALKDVVLKNLEVRGDEVIGKEFEKVLKSKAEIEPIIMISENIRERLEMVKKAKKVYIFAYSADKKDLFAKLI